MSKSVDPIAIIEKYYPEDNELRRLLLHHSRQVADKALDVARRHPELSLDTTLLENGGLLHDIGIFLCDAPGIHCFGHEPYLLHGRLGAALMRKEGLEDIARICERHTGTGLTIEDIRRQNLPIPEGDYRPETMEEQVICYSDKFFSKSHPEAERSVERTIQSLRKFGENGIVIFQKWHEMFG